MSRARRFLLILAGFVGLGLLVLHLSYPLSYVYRVMVYQDPDFSDIYRFPANPVAASSSPSALPLRPDETVVTLIESYRGVGELDRFLGKTSTSAFVVVHDARAVLEWYGPDSGPDVLQNTFSVSKSIMSALVSIAAQDGLLTLADSVTDHLPELLQRDGRFARISLAHLLDMRSGIRYTSGVSAPFFNADDALIYYHPDIVSVALERTSIAGPPGEFQYNNYNPPILGIVLRRTTGTTVAANLERRLWAPMGAEYAAGWSTDDRGMERMESGFHATARDLARFGLLYLQQGRVGDKQLLSEAAVRDATQWMPTSPPEKFDGGRWAYHAGWWIVPRPAGRPDFAAIGRLGQFIYVSPQNDAVFVRTGPGRGEWGDRDWTRLFYAVASGL